MPEQPSTPPLRTDPADEVSPAAPAERPASNAFLAGFKEQRLYRVALGYVVGAWLVLQVAIILPGFGAPVWVPAEECDN